jgi:hypothetical protein
MPPQVVFRYMAIHFFERSYESDGRVFECVFPLMGECVWLSSGEWM